jgi:hypothetical protein
MQTNCTVLAKLKVNKKLNTYRIVFSFDKHNKITVKNAVLETGDICSVDNAKAALYIEAAIKKAVTDLRCTNAQLVD